MRRSLVLVLVAFAVGVTACSSGGGKSTDTNASRVGEFEEGEISRAEPGHLSVEVSGDLDFEYEDDVDLRIVVIQHPEVTAVRFLSVGIEQLKPLPDGTAFRIAFDLAGVFDGAGRYELPAAGETVSPPVSTDPDNPGASAVQGVSKPYLIYSPKGLTENPADVAAVRSFENALKPCELDVDRDDGGKGTLECPDVTDTAGEGRISFRMEWEPK